MSSQHGKRPFFAKAVRVLSIPIILIWIAIAVLTNVLVPTLEKVAEDVAGPMIPHYAPSQRAMLHIGDKFQESNSTSLAMIVFEAVDRPLGEQDHRYYDDLMLRLGKDTAHVQYVMDLWGKSITAAGAQSIDGKATYVLLRIAGDVGQSQANRSVDSIRDIIAHDAPPKGLKVYVSGAAPMAYDTLNVANKSLGKITIVTIIMITIMLLIVYRSITTAVLLPLLTVMIELMSAKGVVASFGHFGAIGLSSFASSMTVSLVLGAGTDYGIFLLGRYHEARQAGEDRESAYYSAFNGVSHVILGSGLTIAGASYCLSFARLDYFKTMGPAVAIAMLLTIAGALTLGPALLTVGSALGLFDPKHKVKSHLYRRIGTSVVRWPVPILVASCAVVMLGAVFVPTYRVSYDDRAYQPDETSAKQGFIAADRHFTQSKLFTEMLMVESDHDMRNSADFISLDRVSKNLLRLPGVAMVQSITRPMGRPLEHSTIPYQFTGTGTSNGEQVPFTKMQNADTTQEAETMGKTVSVLRHLVVLMKEMSDQMQNLALTTEDLEKLTQEMNVDVGNLDDFMRPFRNIFYWETNCYDLPWCWSLRSLFDMLDSIDKLASDVTDMKGSVETTAKLLPQMVMEMSLMADQMDSMQKLMLDSTGDMNLNAERDVQTFDDSINIGLDFDKSRSDDFFYMPRQAFDNEDMKTGIKLMMSPDGKAARFMITHQGNAVGPEGVTNVESFTPAVVQALKETSLAGAKIYIGGSGSNDQDIKQYAASDLLMAAIAAFVLIFLIMLVITRSLIAAFVIISTVAFSFAGAFGLSLLVWQHIIGLDFHWLVLPIAFIILVAVGSDYNLLLIARLKEEIPAGLKTGLIRAVGSTGGVVTSAGLVFAFTMLAMLSSDLTNIGQVGFTVFIGLLLDTLIVRTLIVPSIARLLGPWFWWPTHVRRRPERPVAQVPQTH